MTPRKKFVPIPEHTLVVVRWLDASFDLDVEQDCHTMLTVGFVTKHTSRLIALASEMNDHRDYFRAHTAIPAKMIESIRIIPPENA